MCFRLIHDFWWAMHIAIFVKFGNSSAPIFQYLYVRNVAYIPALIDVWINRLTHQALHDFGIFRFHSRADNR